MTRDLFPYLSFLLALSGFNYSFSARRCAIARYVLRRVALSYDGRPAALKRLAEHIVTQATPHGRPIAYGLSL